MAREALESGDLLNNRWCGAIQFEKPPLLIWSLAGSTSLFGETVFALRLPSTLATALAAAAVAAILLALRAGPWRALFGALLFLGGGLTMQLSRRVMTDMPLVALLLLATSALLSGRRTLMGVALGLALLTKGVAALPLGGLLGLALIAREGWRKSLWPAAVTLLVGLPWFVASTWTHGTEFLSATIGYHAIARAAGGVVPGLTAAELLDVLLLEWPLLVAASIGLGFLIRAAAGHSALPRRDLVVLVVWAVGAAVPPFASGTRLAHYLLPVMPLLALVAGLGVPDSLVASWGRRLGAVAVAVLLGTLGPGTLAFWLSPELGAELRQIGMRLSTSRGDRLLALDLTNPSLTWSSGQCVPMVVTDPRFEQVQRAVLMNTRANVVLDVEAGLGPSDKPRHVVYRLGSGAEPLLESVGLVPSPLTPNYGIATER
ncbi:MAG: glycosyltransferase family 39 protein [Myxococcales bacterium]|nr:glycosyltransferase family 39 protein [Myxococcales bacterium]